MATGIDNYWGNAVSIGYADTTTSVTYNTGINSAVWVPGVEERVVEEAADEVELSPKEVELLEDVFVAAHTHPGHEHMTPDYQERFQKLWKKLV